MRTKINIKKIVIIFFVYLILNVIAVYSQQESINEMESRLTNATPREKAILYLKLSELARKASLTEKVMEYALKAVEIARKTKKDLIEAEALRMIGTFYYGVKEKNEKAIEILNQALLLYEKNGDKTGMYLTLNNIGLIYYNMNNIQDSLKFQLQSLKLKEEQGDIRTINSSLNNIGLIYWHTGNYSKALEFFLKAEKNYKQLGDKQNQAIVLLNIGLVYRDWAEYDQALKYFYKTLEIMETLNNKRSIAVCSNNIATIHQKIGRYEEAIAFGQKALELSRETGYKFGEGNALNSIGVSYQEKKQLDKALQYYHHSLQVKKEIDNKKGIANTLTNIGNILEEQEKFQSALDYFKQALNYNEQIKNKIGIAGITTKIGQIYLKLHQYKNSLRYADISLKLNTELHAKANLKDCYDLYSKIYESTGNPKKALKYYKLHAEMKNSIFTEERDEKISRLQTKYNALQKDKEIENLKISNKLKELTIDRQRITRNVAIIVSLLIFVIFLQFYRQYRYLFTFWKKKNYIAHYKLEHKIGSGGMGDIYKAKDLLGKSKTPSCAIKVLKEEYYKDDSYRNRFKNEASLIDQFHHPNIVKVMERGEHNGSLYIAMELLEGNTLAEILEKENQLSIETVLIMLMQMAEALTAIHKRGIIHRDLKPENIMVTRQENNLLSIKILDFGLAKAQNLTRLTRTGMIMGTIYYLAPEQLTRSTILPAGDVYSLGVIGYQMITGEKPFKGDTAFEIARQILKIGPAEIGHMRAQVPAGLRILIKKMMSKNPEERPSAAEILNHLKKVANYSTQLNQINL